MERSLARRRTSWKVDMHVFDFMFGDVRGLVEPQHIMAGFLLVSSQEVGTHLQEQSSCHLSRAVGTVVNQNPTTVGRQRRCGGAATWHRSFHFRPFFVSECFEAALELCL